ncbi:MAG TPA: diacylglycerol kinase family lipid kinase [Elusimicrobiales bacterium]|nr:diacylglycerol kinase family lipid kinase [Elusimicrobiales bacterium]HOL62679.1 diacylglycerol kinase family lipid kinase [Elusimicrobiales bacterium]HPO95016.1 diacylglycerol kinase family lipid kinase [Elusimicrobiales bacterium]
MNYLFIINPKSGLKINRYIENKIKEKFLNTGHNFIIEYTKYKNHAKEITINYLNKGYDNIIAVGGDGTIKEISSVLAGKNKINLGIIPCGSGNGLARNLSIPLNIDEAIDVILKNKIRKIDCGLCNGDIFISTCGTALDAKVAYLFNNTVHSRGLLPYFFHGALSYFKFKPHKTEVYMDGKKYEFYPIIATVANGRQYGGGAIISPESYMDDGVLELVLIYDAGFLKTLFSLKSLFDSKILQNDFVKCFKSSNFKIILPPKTVYHLDGEDYKTQDGVLNISVLKQSLSVISV